VADAFAAELVPQFELLRMNALRLAALPAGARIIDVAPSRHPALARGKSGATVSGDRFAPAMIANLNRRAANVGTPLMRVWGRARRCHSRRYLRRRFFHVRSDVLPIARGGLQRLRRVLRPGGRAVVSR